MKIVKQCSKCDKIKEFFYYKKYCPSWCVDCRRDKQREKRRSSGIQERPSPIIKDENNKECLKCKRILHVDLFNKNNRGILKRSSLCKECMKQYIRELRASNIEKYRQKTKESTQKYRNKHREYWRSLHRINQFNRKNLIRAQSDNTVNEEFMKKLYALDTCYWCKKIIPISERTAEHIVPLSLGGIHSVNNLTMACISCNLSKINFKNEK